MGSKDPRVDAYIERSADFARPILMHIRDIVHTACPEVEEAIKWGFPNFMYKGMLCSMASFKEHCAFGFWKASLVMEEAESTSESGMGQFGRITTLNDLPPNETLIGYIRKAMQLNEKGIQPAKRRQSKEEPVVPDDFRAALNKEPGALQAFDAMPPSHRREYIEWITGAKRDETRQRRITKAVDQISAGKSLNWKYESGQPTTATPRK